MLPLRYKIARPQDIAFWGESPIAGRQELGLCGCYVNAGGIVLRLKSLKVIIGGIISSHLKNSHI